MVKRHITSFVRESFQTFPSVLINGARQSGKSTLVKQLQQESLVKEYVTLDDLSTLQAAREDPDGFIKQFKNPIAIDEVQRAPDILRAIKKSIDENRRPGRFLLTGSANILSYPRISESLAGRVDIIHLEGLNVREISNQSEPTTFISDLFSGASIVDLRDKWSKELEQKPKLDKDLLAELIFYGGFPEIALKKNPRFCERWMASYQAAYIERDVRDLNRFLESVSFHKLFRLLGLQTGSLMNQKSLGLEVGLDHRTVARYLEILEMTFQTNRLIPWFSNTRKRLIKTPKIYMNDSAQACHLMGIFQPSYLIDSKHWGYLLETWLWAEIRKLITLTTSIECNFYRTHLNREVDFLLTRGFTHWGIECKAAASVGKHDCLGLEDMQAAIGSKVQGIIFYAGDTVLMLSDNILALPFRYLA
jgi:predicted AAA+ superfamily ATPase